MRDRTTSTRSAGAVARWAILAAAFYASPAGAQQLTCDVESGLRAIAGQTPASLSFRNPSAQPRRLYWIDFQGRRKSYGIIAPGADRRQQSSFGNHWVVTDDADHCIAIFEVAPTATTFVIPAPGTNVPSVAVEPAPAVVPAPAAKGPIGATRADAQRPGFGGGNDPVAVGRPDDHAGRAQ